MENTSRFFNWLKKAMFLEKSINTFGKDDDDEKCDKFVNNIDAKKDEEESTEDDSSDDKKENLSELLRLGIIPSEGRSSGRMVSTINKRIASENMSLGLFLAIRRAYIFHESLHGVVKKSKIALIVICNIERNKGTTELSLDKYIAYLKLDKDLVKKIFLNDYIKMTCRAKKATTS